MIGAKRVSAPNGATWRVGRRWMPGRLTLWRRTKKDRSAMGDLFGDPAVGASPDALTALLFVLFLLFLLVTVVVFPLVVIAIELLVVVGALVGGLGGRLLLRKPWTVRARSEDGRELAWRAPGFQRSGRVRDEVAAALALGRTDVHPAEALEPARF